MTRKQIANIVVGALFVLSGLAALGQVIGFWDLSLLKAGWWTLFLIVPAIISMIVSGPRIWNMGLLLLGGWLFADCQGWLGTHGWTLLLGIFLILCGIRALFGWGLKPGEHRHHHHHHHHDDWFTRGTEQD